MFKISQKTKRKTNSAEKNEKIMQLNIFFLNITGYTKLIKLNLFFKFSSHLKFKEKNKTLSHVFYLCLICII